ncbi:DUF1428 domain-containing protein [Nitratireductor sp. XY-223]|uniref:DUF1428 domain-containing protein n=1 Tax=Nitratireductor sp. XY-223 TaxID=2561926 RepID=UPI0010AA988D|nr:DUF1428 domain-containing protein [Nitratireductor sp. XY-223]
MYIAGFVIPVPEERRETFRKWSQAASALLMEYGCLEVVESWEDNVPDGDQTDFRKAVAARPGEKIVFSWQVWPDGQSVQRVEKAMAEDPRFDPPADLPFDQKRLIMGCFRPIHSTRAK